MKYVTICILALLLALPTGEDTDAQRIIVVELGDKRIGMLVDSVSQVIKVPAGVVEEIPVQSLINAGVPKEEAGEYVCYKGQGCPKCNKTGYKGRVGFYQVMPMLEDIRELVLNGANTAEIKRESMRLGIKP